MNSKQAHEDLIKSGRKETLQRQIMEYMHRYKSATFSEVSAFYGVHDSVFWKRFSELARMGLIVKTTQSRINKNSGKNITKQKIHLRLEREKRSIQKEKSGNFYYQIQK